MSLKNLLFVTIFLALGHQVYSQRIREEYSYMGVYGGYSLFDLKTDNLVTEQGSGFVAGFLTRGDWYNKFYMEYGVNYFQSTFGVGAREASNPNNHQFVDYDLSGIQLRLQGGYHIIRHHLGIEFAPILSINGKMKPKSESYNDFLVDGYDTITAEDISNITRVNFRLAAGLTTGAKHFRANVQYQYGVTNILNRLNDEEALANEQPQGGFKGHTHTILFGAYIFF